jgi:hypothetical protein
MQETGAVGSLTEG